MTTALGDTRPRRCRAPGPAVALPAAVVLAVAAGGAWAAAAPPRGWWPLLPLGVATWTMALHGRPLRARLLLGALTGSVFYGVSLLWLTDFAAAGYVAVVVLETGMLALAAAVVPAAVVGRWSGGWWTVPAALTLLDAAQTAFPFGGFPLPTLALSQPDGPAAGAASLGGSLLVTAVAATAGVGLAAPVIARGRRRLLAVAAAVLLVVAPLVAAAAVVTTPAGTLDAAVVQGGGPRGLRAVFTDPKETTDRQLAVTGRVTGSPDLVLLAENVITSRGPVAGTAEDARVAALARELDAPIVVGVTESAGDVFRNAAVLWGPDGRRTGRYEKEHRVPFGEYIPGRKLLETVTDLTSLVPRDAVVGRGTALLDSPSGPLGVVISYEVLFADRVREAITAGGRVVLVPTNASSYVSEEVPAIEVAAARLRAREFGRSVLQAAPTGYSAVVLPDGRVLARSELGEQALLREAVPLRTGLTPYARFGDIPFLAVSVLILCAPALVAGLRRRRIAGAGHDTPTADGR